MELRRIGTTLLALVLVLSLLLTPVAANTVVFGKPDLSVTSPTGPVEANERATFSVAVANDGTVNDGSHDRPDYEEQVTTARNVRVRIDETKLADGIDVKSGTVTFGRLASPDSATADFELELGNVSPGRYRIPIVIEYSHVLVINYDRFEQPEFTDNTETVRTSVVMVVEDRPKFEVVEQTASTVTAGDTGDLAFVLRNDGTETASDMRVNLRSNHTNVQFGDIATSQPTTSIFVPALEPGESTTVQVQTVASRDVSPGTYPVAAAVEYETPSGITERSKPLQLAVDVREEQSFAVRDVHSTLSVGDDGTVTATLVNDGPAAVDNAVVVYRSESRTLHPTETEYAVGTLAPGDASRFQFEFDVSEEADAGPRMPSIVVRYRNADGEVRTSELVDVPVTVGPEEEPLVVEPVTTTVTSGSHATIKLQVTNTGAATLTDVEAKLFADDPLSSNNDEAFVGTLDPGESTTMAFDVGAAGGIIAKTYPVSIDFTYEDAAGDTELSDTYRVPIDVTDPTDRGLPWPLLLGFGLLLVGLVVWKRDTIMDGR